MMLGGRNGRWMVAGEKGRSGVCEKRLFARIFLCWVPEDKTQLLPSGGLYPCWGVKWEMRAGGAPVEYVTVCHQNVETLGLGGFRGARQGWGPAEL